MSTNEGERPTGAVMEGYAPELPFDGNGWDRLFEALRYYPTRPVGAMADEFIGMIDFVRSVSLSRAEGRS